MMRWWSVGKLVAELRARRVSATAQFGYLFGFMIFEAITWNVDALPWAAPDLVYSISVIVCVLKILGPLICFFANGGDRGEDFLLRYVALSFPARIQALVWLTIGTFPILAVVSFIRGFLGIMATVPWSVYAIPYFGAGLTIIHLVIVFKALRGIRRLDRFA